MKKFYLIFLFSLLFNQLLGIHSELATIINNKNYILGRGEAPDYETAALNASMDLSNQISMTVKSRFIQQQDEVYNQSDSQKSITANEYSKSIVSTYSASFINNTETKVFEPTNKNPNYIIYKYIKKTDMQAIFQARKERAIDFLKMGNRHRDLLNINRALLDYYSGLLLISSLPDHTQIRVTTEVGQQNLKLALEEALITTFSQISFSQCSRAQEGSNFLSFSIKGFYQDKPITNLQYSYFGGNNLVDGNINQGCGSIELLKSYFQSINELSISVKYGKGSSSKQQLMDEELKALEGLVSLNCFDNKYTLKLPDKTTTKKAKLDKEFITKEEMERSEKRDLKKMMEKITNSIRDKDFFEIKKFFTEAGFNQYLRVMNRGDVSVYEEDFTLKYFNLGHQIQIRSLPITYRIAGSRPKVMVEKINFIVENDSISWVNYSLDDRLIEEAIEKNQTTNDLESRLMSINFMEYYKTIFNTKQIDLISDIFSENAKIFVGYVKRSEAIDFDVFNEMNNQLKNKINIRQYSKEEYINNLESVFKNNNFINIAFRNPDIIKRSKVKDIYALQMHQDFYSDNYSDQGYLLLFVDFTDKIEPKIFFRFWQPERINEEGLRQITPGDVSW